MVVEILVLGRHEGLNDGLRNGLDRQEEPPFVGVFGDEAAINGVEAGHDRRLVFLKRRVIGQILCLLPDIDTDRGRADEAKHCGRREQTQKQAHER